MAMASHQPVSPASTSARNPRICTREACDTCRDKKAKCDGGKPCSRCDQRSLACVYESRNYRTKRSLRDEIASLKQRNQEQSEVIEGLLHEHDHDHEHNHDQTAFQSQSVLPSPRSSIAGAPEQGAESPSSSLSRQECAPADQSRRVSDANNAFVDMHAESSRMACDLVQDMPILNTADVNFNGCDEMPYLPWDAVPPYHQARYTSSDANSSISLGSDAASASQDTNPMFTLHNPAAFDMGSAMGIPQMPANLPWNAYQPQPPEMEPVAIQPAVAATTAPTPPLSPSSPHVELKPATSHDTSNRNQPASRERHRLASARNWRKQKTATADLQATKHREEARHTVLQTQYAEIAEQVRYVKHALLDHAACDDPAIGRWLQQEAREVSSLKAEGHEIDENGNDNGKRNHANEWTNVAHAKSRKHEPAHVR